MKITLDAVRLSRGGWSMTASGTFGEGIHLISGDVGSGKSTLAAALAGLLTPSSGSIVRTGIGSSILAFQFPEFHITGSTLREECNSWGVDPAPVLEAAGLAGRDREDPLQLSRGELKRLVLACVLAGNHDLLILDEPFSSLDNREKERLCRILSARKRGITILSTHEQTFFPRVDHIWEIRDAVLFDRGTLPEAILRWTHAPVLIRDLVAAGRMPENITPDDIREAACRTSG